MTDDAPEPAATIVPPRPNLGPEPLSEPGLSPAWTVLLAVALLATILFIAANRRRRQTPAAESSSDLEPDGDLAEVPSPREQLIARANSVRSALVSRFGESWQAKTTEEIAIELETLAVFDAETTASIVALLRDADLAKFSRQSDGHSQRSIQGWDDWVAGFLETAGASSTIKGK